MEYYDRRRMAHKGEKGFPSLYGRDRFRGVWMFSLWLIILLYTALCFPYHVSADTIPALTDDQFKAELIGMTDAYDRSVTQQQAQKDPYVNGRLIVMTRGGVLDPEKYGAVSAIRDQEGCYILQFAGSSDARRAADVLREEDNVLSAEPDVPLFAQQVSFSAQSEVPANWGTAYTGCDVFAEYAASKGSNAIVRVAVIDSGIRKTHELFKDRLLSAGEFDFVHSDKDASDDNGHGTMVAGVIVECSPGLNQVKLIPVKALDSKGETEVSTIMLAMKSLAGKDTRSGAYYRHADVINLSFVSVTAIRNSSVLKNEIAEATAAGAVVVLAAGNQNEDTSVHPPANITDSDAPGSIIVSSCDSNGRPSNFSNYGASVDLCAPGSNVVTAYYSSDRGYALCNGSSFSAPCVCAAAAMVKLVETSLSPSALESRLESYVKPIEDSSGRNYGSGILDLTKGISVSPSQPDDPGNTSYPGTNPHASVTYKVPMKKNTATSVLWVAGLAGGDTVTSWRTSDSARVQVTGKADGTCRIRALNQTGSAVVTAKTASGQEVRFRIKVQKGAVQTKAVSVASKTMVMKVGETAALTPLLKPVTSTQKVKFTSNRKQVVTVSKTGVLSGRLPGTAVITIQSGKKKVKVKVTVTAANGST